MSKTEYSHTLDPGGGGGWGSLDMGWNDAVPVIR